MLIDPKPGLVIRYDFLWKEETNEGRELGYKDRPCAIILKTKPKKDGSVDVVLCPITHSPPQKDETGIEIPQKVARYLKLDDELSWVKTYQVNTLNWQKNRIPFGVIPAYGDQWTFGQLPQALGKQIFEQVFKNSKKRVLVNIVRTNE